MGDIELAYKYFLWCLLIIPLLIVWYILKHKHSYANVQFSGLELFNSIPGSIKIHLRHILFALRVISLVLLIIVLARPQSSTNWQNVTTKGIDIVIALDISGSMLAEDFKPNRLEACKDVALDFIDGRQNDRVGLVVYSGESFTQCPLTTDHSVLKELFGKIKNGMIEDGTAIGMGLATSVNRLKDSDAISKVIILLTDGNNTTGLIPPVTAAEIAKSFDIRVYTIGVGTNGLAPYPFKNPYGKGYTYQKVEVKIDEGTLKQIANITGGNYFRATNNRKLEEIYKEIDKLEKSKIEVTEFRKKNEKFLPWLLAACVLLFVEFILRNTVFKVFTA